MYLIYLQAIQIQHLLKLNFNLDDCFNTLQNSNTTLVKVKYYLKQKKALQVNDSNTTLVKVKL